MAGDAAAPNGQADQLLARALGLGLLERGPADEVALLAELDHSTEARLERGRVGAQLVAVERHPGLQAQRVAGAEPDRNDAGRSARLHQGIPDAAGGGDLHEDLEAVLARVAGAGDEGRHAGHAPLADRVVAQIGDRNVRQRRQDRQRQRALDGHQGGRQGAVVQDDVEALDAFREGVAHRRRVRGVGDDHEPLLAEAIDDQVVEDAAVREADHRVVRAAHFEARPAR